MTEGHVVKLVLGIHRPVVCRQHSFTYPVLCDHQRGALTSGHWDQTDTSEFYGNFLTCCWLPVFLLQTTCRSASCSRG